MRIAITGPESTGKSWLAEELAKHYNTTWVPEYAREYLTKLNRAYTFDDILKIAENQHAQEQNAAKKLDLVFCDTDFCVTSIWCKVKFGKCHDWITDMMQRKTYSLHLLCNIDLPWQYDPLREHPEMRDELFQMYVNELSLNNLPYKIISGAGIQRLNNAIHEIDDFINLR